MFFKFYRLLHKTRVVKSLVCSTMLKNISAISMNKFLSYAQPCSFLCGRWSINQFNKPAKSNRELLQQWKEIPDEACSKRYLEHISYYHFSAYTIPFQQLNIQF